MIKNIIKFSISNIINLILGMFSAIILTRVFSPEIYGILNIFNTTVTTGLSVLYLGLDSSYIRFYNEPPVQDSNKELGTKLLIISLTVTIVSAIIVICFFYRQFTLRIFGICNFLICEMVFISIIGQIILRFLNIKYRMDFNVRDFTIQAVLTQIVLKFFVIITALFSLDINCVILTNALGIFILALIYLYIQRKSFFSKKNLIVFNGYKPIFLFAFFSMPLSICINLNTWMTQQIISYHLNVASVGVYSSAGYFANILGALQGGFSTFWSAYMYAHYRDKQSEIKRVNEYLLFAIIIIFAVMILGKDLVYFLIGKQFQESKQFFTLTLAYPIFLLAAETTTYGISIEKKTHLSLCCFIFSIIINISLAYILIPYMGLKGAASASMISGFILYVLRSFIGQKYYQSIFSIKMTVFDILMIILLSAIPAFAGPYISNICVIVIMIVVCLVNLEKIKDIFLRGKYLLKLERL